jgi:nucleotide-binding universal stress UspA family protein
LQDFALALKLHPCGGEDVMPNIKHILFPIDFSSRCCAAAPYVEAMAHRFGAKVTLISVAQPFLYTGMGDPGGAMVIDTDDLLRELKARLGGVLIQEFSHLEVERVADLGDPSQAIVDFAGTAGVNLIMMPTHGYGPFRSLLLGSVTAKVLHDSEVPIWTAAHVAEQGRPGHAAGQHLVPHSILCAVDGTAKSIPLMEWATALSKDFGAALRLVHIVPALDSWPAIESDRQFEAELRLEARKNIEALQETAGVVAPLCVAVGEVAVRVSEEARRHGADLVVIGRGVLHETLGRLRTHAYGIIRHSPCPVISV